jgi:hypothetical protein
LSGCWVAWELKTSVCLSSTEGDDAADRIVRGDADGHAITGDDLDSKAAHPAAQLREDFVTGVALNAIETTRMYRDDCALHINQIVFAQSAHPFSNSEQ